jgi:two-component system response regulator RegA
MKRILLLEDDEQLRESLAREFMDRGYDVTQKRQYADVREFHFHFAVVDLRLESENGLRAVEGILKRNSDCRLVVLTGYGSVATAVEAIKLGAVNYLTKPASIDIIEKALLGELKSTELPDDMLPLSKHEHEYIEFVVTQNHGNITRSAKVLGLHRSSLQRKLKKNP